MAKTEARLTVRVTPRASKNAVEAGEEIIKVRVTAAPNGGKANTAVCAVVAKALGVPKSAVSLERGRASRTKRLIVAGLTTDDVRTRLAAR